MVSKKRKAVELEVTPAEAQEPPLKNLLDQALLQRAVGGLLKLVADAESEREASKQQAQLFEEEDTVTVQFSLRKLPERHSAKPRLIRVPHPLLKADSCQMCLFVNEKNRQFCEGQLLAAPPGTGKVKEAREAARKAGKLPPHSPVEGLTKIISLDTLRKEYATFKYRRDLLGEFDLFLCDDSILPMMTKALGKAFFSKKKQPVPVRVTRQTGLPKQIIAARDNTMLYASHGLCWAMRVALTNMTAEQITQNIAAAVEQAVDSIPGKWSNMVAIHIKSSHTAALPIFLRREELSQLQLHELNAAIVKPLTEEEQRKKEAKQRRHMKSMELREQLKALKQRKEAVVYGAREEMDADMQIEAETTETATDELEIEAPVVEAPAVVVKAKTAVKPKAAKRQKRKA